VIYFGLGAAVRLSVRVIGERGLFVQLQRLPRPARTALLLKWARDRLRGATAKS